MNIMSGTIVGITKWAAAYPRIEVTGFVKRFPSGLEVVVPMQNTSLSPTTDYAWDPDEMKRQWDVMDKQGSEPVAFYHSHPSGRSKPSEVDMAAALVPDMAHLIAYPCVGGGHWHVTGWMCLERGILVSEPLVPVTT
jgi:proteasome lid subunit RPN8/RPN11